MKRSLLIMVVAVGVLGALTWAVTREPEAPEQKVLTVAGYATAAQLEAEKNQGIMTAMEPIPYPIDEVIIERPGEARIRLRSSGEGKELSWRLEEPMAAVAVRFAVEQIVRSFKDETASVHARAVEPADLARYGLDAESRIGLTLKAGGAVYESVDLWVGEVATSDREATEGGKASDTWVMRRDDEGTAYRLAGKDLRTPLQAGLDTLRDKKLFDVKGEDLVHLEVQPPWGAKLVLDGERTEKPGGAPGDPPKHEVVWRISEPAGFEVDPAAATLARNLANGRAKAFVAEADAPPEAANALDGSMWTLSARTHDGRELALELAADGGAEGDEKAVWGRVPGTSEFLKLDDFTAKNLQKTIADVRDKTLLGLAADELVRLTMAADGGPVTVEKRASGWVFVTPKQRLPADPAAALTSIAGAKVTRYAWPDELQAAETAVATPAAEAVVATDKASWQVKLGAEMTEPPYERQRWVQVIVRDVGGEPRVSEPALLAQHMVGRFQKGADDLLRKQLFEMDRDSIDRLEVMPPGGETLVLERDPTTRALGPQAVPEGKAVKAQVVTTMVATLASLRAKELAPEQKPADVGLSAEAATRVVATLSDGRRVSLLLGPKPDTGDPWAVAESGPLAGVVVKLNGFQALNLTKSLDDLLE